MFRPVTVLLVLLLTAASARSAAQTSTARVAGRVVDVVTGEPIEGARVTLTMAPAAGTRSATPVTPSARPLIATTNPDGAFAIADVPPGRWRIQVQKLGFFVAGDNAQDPVVDVTTSVTLPDIPLDRGGAIDGRVIDAKGNPVSDVRVTAAPRRLPDGATASAGRSAGTQTNDLGQFRLAGLPPGEYHVLAQRIAPLTNAAPSTTVYVQTYYPGVADSARADVLTVRRGLTTSALDLRLLAVAAYQVSGVAVDATGRPAPGALVLLMATPPGRVTVPLAGTAQADGTFRILNVPAGTYRAGASMPVPRPDASTSASAGSDRQPLSEVVVNDEDVTGVQVVVRTR